LNHFGTLSLLFCEEAADSLNSSFLGFFETEALIDVGDNVASSVSSLVDFGGSKPLDFVADNKAPSGLLNFVDNSSNKKLFFFLSII